MTFARYATCSILQLIVFLTLATFFSLQARAQSIDSFTLINADTDQPIRALSSSDELQLDALPTSNLSIRVNTSPSNVGSVRFSFAGQSNFQTESFAPYALGGDRDGDYNAVPELAQTGTYTLTATPYPKSGGQGTAGTPKTISFTVSDGGSSPGDPPPSDPTCSTDPNTPVDIDGDRKRWHPLTLTFSGPCASEDDATNPFLNYRLTVTFRHSGTGTTVTVPGYFAADGDAANTSATSGNKWRAHLNPSQTGTWTYEASFRTGPDVAISLNPTAGTATSFDGRSGSFSIAETDKSGRDHRGKGVLRYVGERYLQFEDGTYFLKGGADSPENLLAYSDFDGTYNAGGTSYVRAYDPHTQDWTSGDPTWQDGKGKGLIGGLNYLASEGMNAFSFLPMNVKGDGKDVWPWTAPGSRLRYDVSKLAQWEIVFTHADHLGLFKHFKTQETENDQLLDGGNLGRERKLYYRELVARFGHHHALNWNLGEEYDVFAEKGDGNQSRLKGYANYIRDLDPYDHPIVVHTYPGDHGKVYPDLLGFDAFEGPSIQLNNMRSSNANEVVRRWVNRSVDAGRPWNVSIDEPGNASEGLRPDGSNNYDDARGLLWATFFAGGDGIEWYFGYQYRDSDLTLKDWRSRDQFWDYHRHALAFMRDLPITAMESNNNLLSGEAGYVFADGSETFAVYLEDGGTGAALNLPSGTFDVQWYNPRTGGSLKTGSVKQVEGGTQRNLGAPPNDSAQDWVVLVTSTSEDAPDPSPDPTPTTAYAINVGGPSYSGGGVDWAADQYATGGRTYNVGDDIAGTSDDRRYHSERYGKGFSYRFPVSNGTYTVRLHFAEIYFTKTGKRVFSVDVENGQGGLDRYDIVADVGAFTATTKTFDGVSVTDGTLDIDFTASVNNAKVSAIEILATGSSANSMVAKAEPEAKSQTVPTFELRGSYPNPFTERATIAFVLPDAADVSLAVYDMLGRKVAQVVDRPLRAGEHTVEWSPNGLASGMYLYRLRAGANTATGRMVLVK